MHKRKLIGIVAVSIAAGMVLGLTLPGLLNIQNDLYDPNNPPIEDENAMIILTSGTYTGRCLYAKNLIVPAGQSVTFQNAQILGGEIYVFGTLTILSSVMDHEIRVHDTGIVSLNNALDVSGNVNYTYVWVYAYESTQVTVTGDSRVYLQACDNATFSFIGNDGFSAIVCFDTVKGNITDSRPPLGISFTAYYSCDVTFKNSTISSTTLARTCKIYLKNSSSLSNLYTYGLSSSYPYCQAIIYKDATSTIASQTLVDGAQIINI